MKKIYLILLFVSLFGFTGCGPNVDFNNKTELSEYLQGTWVVTDRSSYSDAVIYYKIVISDNKVTYYMKLGENTWGEPQKESTFKITDKMTNPLTGRKYRVLSDYYQGLMKTLTVYEDAAFYYGNQELRKL